MKFSLRNEKRRRAVDYALLTLSLVGVLTVYEMVVGCAGSLPPSATYNQLDENPKTSSGRIELSGGDPCTSVQLSNNVELNGVAECGNCGQIDWSAGSRLGLSVNLAPGGDFTTVEICLVGNGPQVNDGFTSVTVRGRYGRQRGLVTTNAFIVRRIPLKVPGV